VSIGAYDLIQLPASVPIQRMRIPMQKTESCNCGNGTPPARERAGRYRSSASCEKNEFWNYRILDRS
jgi:hypothetical protein